MTPPRCVAIVLCRNRAFHSELSFALIYPHHGAGGSFSHLNLRAIPRGFRQRSHHQLARCHSVLLPELLAFVAIGKHWRTSATPSYAWWKLPSILFTDGETEAAFFPRWLLYPTFPLRPLSLAEMYCKSFVTVTTWSSVLLVPGITNHIKGKVILLSIISISQLEMGPRSLKYQLKMCRRKLWPSSCIFSWVHSSITESGVISTLSQNKMQGLSVETS